MFHQRLEPSIARSLCALQPAPATGAIVRRDRLDKLGKRVSVQCFASAHLYCPRGLIALSLIDDPFRVGRDGIIDENVDVVPRRQQRADVAFKHEVRAIGALDRFGNIWLGGMDQVTNLAADGLLPIGEGIDVGVNARVGDVRHCDSWLPIHRR